MEIAYLSTRNTKKEEHPLTDHPNPGALLGTAIKVPIRKLSLDPENPRLPVGYRGKSQLDLAVVLEIGFEAYAVAQSIAESGFFSSEPLLAIMADPEQYVVVEGNRRLTALIGLTNAEVRSNFAEADRWEALAETCTITLDDEIPIVVHPDRESTHREVGRAHVIGKLSWTPFAQAKYIAARIDEGMTYQEVGDLIGIPKSDVANMYRNQAISKQAQELGLATSAVEEAFSLLTVTMSSPGLRDHIGAPLGPHLIPGTPPIPVDKVDELREMITWVFGGADKEPLIKDSRQISALGRIVAHEPGLAALREGLSIEKAKQRIETKGMDPRDRLKNRLMTAKNAIVAAGEDLSEFADDADINALVSEVDAAMNDLRAAMSISSTTLAT